MKIVLTGSLGHIGKPLSEELVQKKHAVTVISSNAARQKEIEALGADAAIGSVDNVEFLAKTFTGADVVYCMTPPDFTVPDQIAYYEKITNAQVAAIKKSGVKRALYLSSYGADEPSGTGFIIGSHRSEKIFKTLTDVSITFIRPGFFYYNLLSMIGMIKHAGFIGNVYGGEDKLLMVAPADIAAAIAEEIISASKGNIIRHVASDDRNCNEVAEILGKAIGKPGLQWKILPAGQVTQGMLQNGVPEDAAKNLVELGEATHSGLLRKELNTNEIVFGKIKIEDFAKDFAAAYNKQ